MCEAQHGFRNRRSCESQLLLCIDDIASSLDKGEQVDIILLDFQKAFDKVPHKRLIHKLEKYGIRGQLSNWIVSFLSDRSQIVVLNGINSDEVKVTSGVPQGSVLGPTLFTIFINDLPNAVNSKVRLFADDCIVYRTIKGNEDVKALQNDVDIMQQWANESLMSFHPEKCELLRVTNKRNPVKGTYRMDDHILKDVNNKKYLGVTLQNKLNWNRHIQNICAKASSTLGVLRRNMGSCPRAVKERCYKTLVRPAVEYSSTVWDPHTSQNIEKLERIQRRGARFVNNNYDRFASPSAMIKELGWEPLIERRAKAKAITTYKIINQLIDIPRERFIQSNLTCTRSQSTLLIPFCRTNIYKFSYFPSAAKLWNTVPVYIRDQRTLAAFKSSLDQIQLI